MWGPPPSFTVSNRGHVFRVYADGSTRRLPVRLIEGVQCVSLTQHYTRTVPRVLLAAFGTVEQPTHDPFEPDKKGKYWGLYIHPDAPIDRFSKLPRASVRDVVWIYRSTLVQFRMGRIPSIPDSHTVPIV